MPSSPDAHWSLEIYPSIPSMEDMIELNEKTISGLEEVLSILDRALADFDRAVSEIGITSSTK